MGIALLFLVVFGVFGWFVYKAYRFLAWNAGDESPEFHPVTQEISFAAYWLRVTPVVGVIMGLLALVAGMLLFQLNHLGAAPVGVTLAMTLVFGYGAWQFLSLEWRFWRILDGVRVIYDPQDGSMEIQWLGRTIVVTPQNVARLEIHVGDLSSQLLAGMGYMDAYLTDGQRVRLHWEYFHHQDFMKKHYGAVPEQMHTYRHLWSFSGEVLSRMEKA